MNTKTLAREAMQKLHDAFNAIPEDDGNDFDREHYNNFTEAMENATRELKAAASHSMEAKMKADAIAWAKNLPDK